MNRKKITFITAIMLTLTIIFSTGCTEGFARSCKSCNSNLNGGLYRTVTVYDYNGNEIKSWEGKFDIEEDDQEITFDLNNKRVIIQGGIIISEEK